MIEIPAKSIQLLCLSTICHTPWTLTEQINDVGTERSSIHQDQNLTHGAISVMIHIAVSWFKWHIVWSIEMRWPIVLYFTKNILPMRIVDCDCEVHLRLMAKDFFIPAKDIIKENINDSKSTLSCWILDRSSMESSFGFSKSHLTHMCVQFVEWRCISNFRFVVLLDWFSKEETHVLGNRYHTFCRK